MQATATFARGRLLGRPRCTTRKRRSSRVSISYFTAHKRLLEGLVLPPMAVMEYENGVYWSGEFTRAS